MRQEIGQVEHMGRGGGRCARSALAPAAQAEDFLSALFGAFGRPQARRTPLPFANEGNNPGVPQNDVSIHAPVYSGGSQAYCVRTCDGRYFPMQRPATRARRPPATVSARPAKPRWSMAAISIVPPPRAESPIRSCRTLFAIATSWSRAAPATARTRSASRRSKSRTIPTLRKGDLVAGADGLMVAGRGADNAARR